MGHTLKTFLLFIAAFIEGFILLFLEISTPVAVAPVFGQNLHVWSSMLGITLLSLMLGYFAAAYIMRHLNNWQKLFPYLFLWLSVYQTVIYFIVSKNQYFLNLNYYTGLFLYISLVIVPPVVLCGLTNTMLITLADEIFQNAGRAAAWILGISTFGGILSSLMVAFVFLPQYGLLNTLIFMAMISLIPSIFMLKPKYRIIPWILICSYTLFFVNYREIKPDKTTKTNVIFKKYTPFGEILVADFPFYTESEWIPARGLFLNRIGQSLLNLNSQKPVWPYVNFTVNFLDSIFPNKDSVKILISGLGAGTLPYELQQKKFQISVIENEPILYEVMQKFFYASKIPVIFQDFRYFLNKNNQKFDVIILDHFCGENPPNHLYSLEFFNSIMNSLDENGWCILNFFGYYEGKFGEASRCIFHTINKISTNFRVYLSGSTQDQGNLLFFIRHQKNMTPWPPINLKIITPDRFNKQNAFVIRDFYTGFQNASIYPSVTWRLAWQNSLK